MSLLDDVITKKPRETSGSSSANRFSFQVNWAFLKLIELHRSGQEYLIILDLHDDVVVADSETAPTKLNFFQLKTSRKRPWTELRLLRRKTKKTLSIVGKLYNNRLTFPDYHGVSAFVSEARCELPFASSVQNDREILFVHLSADCKKKILKQLREEHALDKDPDCDNCIQFVLTDLRIDKQPQDVQGELSEFCKTISPDGHFPVAAVYHTIGFTMRQRNDREGVPNTVEDLIRRKAIGRTEVQAILDKMTPLGRLSTVWGTASAALTNAKVGLFEVKSIASGWSKYAANRFDASNRAVRKLQKQILRALETVKDKPEIITAKDLLDHVIPSIGKVPVPFQGSYLKAAILLEFFDEQFEQLPSTN